MSECVALEEPGQSAGREFCKVVTAGENVEQDPLLWHVRKLTPGDTAPRL